MSIEGRFREGAILGEFVVTKVERNSDYLVYRKKTHWTTTHFKCLKCGSERVDTETEVPDSSWSWDERTDDIEFFGGPVVLKCEQCGNSHRTL